MPTCSTCARAHDEETRFCPFDGTPLGAGAAEHAASPRPDPLLGVLVDGRFRITARLGQGGMSVVYLARHERLERDVALKVLRPALETDARAVARFAREARAASRIDHDNVVSILDFGRAEDGSYFLVMEHVAGTTLEREIERSAPLPPPRVAHVVAQIAVAMDRAHTLGVIHRDLKPSNVVLTARSGDRDFVKILDFGLSKLTGSDDTAPALTRAGEIFGTPEYMAPEQWEGRNVDVRTDLYALGVLTFEMLTGVLPFTGNVPALMKQHLLDPAPRPCERVSSIEVPDVLEAIVMRTLAKDPAARYQSAAELLVSLGKVWQAVPGRKRRSTYAMTRAAPAPRALDSVPDATVYQSNDVNVVWDGPELCGEIRRLHALRGKRLAELAEALWGNSPPSEVVALRHPINELEALIDRDGQEVAVLHARREEVLTALREEEAILRQQQLDASLRRSMAQRTLPFVATPGTVHDDEEPTLPAGTGRDELHVVSIDLSESDDDLRLAERRLSAFSRHRQRQELALDAALAAKIVDVRNLETNLMPLYEELSRHVRRAAARRPELRAPLVAFGQIDGAIASYQALLGMLDVT